MPCGLGAVEDQLGDRGGIQGRARVRRAAQAGDAAGSGGARFAGDAALAAEAGFAEGHAEIDQAGAEHQAGGFDPLLGAEACGGGADGQDLIALDVQVVDAVDAAGGVEQAGAEDGNGHQSCSSASLADWRWAVWPLMVIDSTAMRMAMP